MSAQKSVKRGRFKTLEEKDHPGRQSPHAGLNHLIANIRKEIKSRGSDGFLGLQRRFRIMDDDGSKNLSLSEFKKALQEFKLNVTEVDIRSLFEYFDTDDSGAIDFEEFVQGLREPLTDGRLKLVHMAFRVLDKDDSGEVDFQEIASMYDASKHPEVMSRRKTAEQVLVAFLNTFEVGGSRDGIVTKQEFVNYYTNLSTSIDDEYYFELMIRNAWHMTGGEGASANTSNMRVLVTDSAGIERTVVLQNDLGISKSDVVSIYDRLARQGETDVKAINGKKLQFTTDNNRLVVAVAGTVPQLEAPNFKLPHLDRLPRVKAGAQAVGKPISSLVPLSSVAPTSPSEPMFKSLRVASPLKLQQERMRIEHTNMTMISTLLDVLRVQLLSRGPAGIIELQRKFVDMDSDGSKSLNYNEFKQAVLSNKLAFSDEQLKALFGYFDSDESGDIDYEELLFGLRGQLPPSLLVLVHQVFDLLDKQGVDSIDPQNLISHFDANRHPEVLSRAKSAQAVQKEFLDTFDVGGEVPGKITRAEFVRYYTNIRASYNDDDFLEVVLRKVWRPDAAEGVKKSPNKKDMSLGASLGRF